MGQARACLKRQRHKLPESSHVLSGASQALEALPRGCEAACSCPPGGSCCRPVQVAPHCLSGSFCCSLYLVNLHAYAHTAIMTFVKQAIYRKTH